MIGHLNNFIIVSVPIDKIFNSKTHWAVYLAALLYYLIISSNIILSFRKSIRETYSTILKQSRLLEKKNEELEEALREIRQLSGLLPICSSCKKIRDDQGDWKQIESYIENNSEAQFSHSLCEECYEKLYGDKSWNKKKT